MAIIKTENTERLASELSERVLDAIYSGRQVAAAADILGDKLAAAAPGVEQGTAVDGAQWRTELGAGSASYLQSFDAVDVFGWSKSGTIKHSFAGSNLDQGNAGAESLASRYSLVSSTTFERNEPGYIASNSYTDRIDAAVAFDRAVPGRIELGNFTRVLTTLEREAGFADGDSGYAYDEIDRSSETLSFKGSSVVDVSGATATLLSATVYGVSRSLSSSWRDERSEDYGKQTERLSLNSKTGLTYSNETGWATLTGTLDSLTYDLREGGTSGGEAWQAQEYYKFVGSDSPDDDIDLQTFIDYARYPSYTDLKRVMEQLFKGDDTLLVSNHVEGGELYGGAGNDRMIGGKAGDELLGGDGNDVISGGSGNDELMGDAGDDTLRGDAGDDLLDGSTGNDSLDGGVGNDRLEGAEGDDRLLGGTGNDQLFGGAGDDLLDGGNGVDNLYAGEGNDQLKGGAGHDVMFGDEGDDTLDGGAGDDYIVGGAGRDLMTGGSGRDGFYFFAGDSGDAALSRASLDQITGFNISQDQLRFDLDFTAADIQVLGQGASYAALLEDAEAGNALLAVGYDGSSTYVFADFDGNGTLDLAVELVGIKGDAVLAGLDIRVA